MLITNFENRNYLGWSLKPPSWLTSAAKSVANVGSPVPVVSSAVKTAVEGVSNTLAKVNDNSTTMKVIETATVAAIPGIGIPLAAAMIANNAKAKGSIVNAVKVNADNLVKAAKKVSMNKIIDSLTPGVILPDDQQPSTLQKILPWAAAGIGALTIFSGE
jgi:hypothetical protein